MVLKRTVSMRRFPSSYVWSIKRKFIFYHTHFHSCRLSRRLWKDSLYIDWQSLWQNPKSDCVLQRNRSSLGYCFIKSYSSHSNIHNSIRGTDINVKIQLFRQPLFHILYDLCVFYLNFYRSCTFSSNIIKLFVSIGQIYLKFPHFKSKFTFS